MRKRGVARFVKWLRNVDKKNHWAKKMVEKLTNWELYQHNSVNEYRNDILTVYIQKLSYVINNVGNVFPIRNVLN